MGRRYSCQVTGNLQEVWTRWSFYVSGSVSVLTWVSCELTVSRIPSSPLTHTLGRGDTSCADLPAPEPPCCCSGDICVTSAPSLRARAGPLGRTGSKCVLSLPCVCICPVCPAAGEAPMLVGLLSVRCGPLYPDKRWGPWVEAQGQDSEVPREAVSVEIQSGCFHSEVHGSPSTWVTMRGQLLLWRVSLMVRC